MEERLQKILAGAGVSSRRAAERMISDGRISVNGVVVRQPGTKADADRDEIRVDGKLISCETEKVYIVLNKPSGYVTTLSDPEGRPIVTDLLSGVAERVFPVGRLDYDSEGLLLLTNDGDFAQRLQHPRFKVPKTYRVKIEGRLNRLELQSLEKGMELPDGKFAPSSVIMEKVNPKSTWLLLTIHDGRNRVIRRAFDLLGHSVTRLIRVSFGDLTLDSLGEGEWRALRHGEVGQLMAQSQAQKNSKKLA
ncbi:MAG: rRNA pseudouridine synthase [Syntrophobacterales bacterium]|nr:rRNA pseudouridine synthase [Syntrophobacterales bacterium]